MASSLFATQSASAASMGSKRKRDFPDDNDSPRGGGGGGGGGMGGMGGMQPGSGRTMKRWRNGRPREEEVYQYTLQKLFSAQSQSVQPSPLPQTTHQVPPFVHQQSRTAASPPKNAYPPRGPPPPRPGNTNPFAAMGHTKPAAGVGLLKFMCAGAGAASARFQAGGIMSGVGEVVACEDCDRRMELTGLGDEEGRCGGCARRVCEGGCSIERGDGGRICLECAISGY